VLDAGDRTFASLLEREIRKRLQGEPNGATGLYRQALGSNDWETFIRIKGIIFAYEETLDEMKNITRRMNEGEEPVRDRA
jgi:hypothetical protein